MAGILAGMPIAFALAGISAAVGVLTQGPQVFEMFRLGVYSILGDYIFLAVPLFVFMGGMIEKTGITQRMFDTLYIWMGGLRGGLAIVTIIIGTILAACVGVVAASVIMLGMIGIPAMLNKGYDKKLICGAICASGSLGILIPPSVMIVMYGPTASLSVGKLFMAAFTPGVLLSGLYILYVYVRCLIKPELGPPVSIEERQIPFVKKLVMLLTSLFPPLLLIFAVLGSIIFGLATPTEASAVGALASVLLAAGYRSLTLEALKDVCLSTVKVSCLAQMVAWGAKMFTNLFLKMGCGDVVTNALLSIPLGKWGTFFVIMALLFVLGMFIDWLGIIFIMVPIVTPLAKVLGFDPIWFAMMIIVNLQFSFITPPFAYAIFYLKGIVKDEWGIATKDIISGIIPYLGLIAIAIILFIAFPNIILWLPNLKFN
ncbi:MAG: TRAP transporter large permease subunit [Peptococcaceae bacterium]|nr:TRAP transporter large permease subunit [Peptococcaceae bacterium]MDH7525376.1 TRAP transporter large permease subunit [Peptococcaceae bacterium]